MMSPWPIDRDSTIPLVAEMKEKRFRCAATLAGNTIYIVGGWVKKSPHSSCEVFDVSTNTWSSPIPDMKKKRRECQAVTVGTNIYVMGGQNSYTTLSSVELFEISVSSLYPTDDNYIMIGGGYRSPKLLENLCIEQFCRSLPDLDGDVPPRHPQYVINAIVQSLMTRGALNKITSKPFRHYKLNQLPSALSKEKVFAVVDETVNGSVCRFSKRSVETASTWGSRNNGTESYRHKKAKMTTNK